jgi:hypothetical protein
MCILRGNSISAPDFRQSLLLGQATPTCNFLLTVTLQLHSYRYGEKHRLGLFLLLIIVLVVYKDKM